MEVKSKDVNIWGLQIEMQPVLKAAEKIWKDAGIENGVTITSARDGIHSAGSYHYYGYAVDLRTRYFTPSQLARVVASLRSVLDPQKYDIIVHNTHIHIEYDPK